MANLQRQSLVDRKHFCLNSQLEILRKTGVFPSFESSCGSVDFPRPSLLVASLPCRPIPALPAHSLCSSPQRKCQVWPLEGAGGPVRTKKSLGFPTPPPPPPTHHDDRWCSSCATKCSRSAAGEGCDVREGCTRDSTNVSVFLSKGSLLRLHSWCCYSGRGAVCGNFQLSQTLSSQQRRRRRGLLLTHTSIARTLTTT